MASAAATTQAPTDLLHECRTLHQLIFRFEAPPEVAAKYIEAHTYYLTEADIRELVWLEKALKSRLDLEAVEVFMRVTGREHILVRKMKILVYICEAYQVYYDSFINEYPQRRKALVSIGFEVIRSGYKIVKGAGLFFFYRNLVKNV